MEDFVIASNADNRIEAFYIENGTVMHTWQKTPNEPLNWTAGSELTGSGGTSQPPKSASRVEACTDNNGQIHVIAYTNNDEYFTCYQSPGAWNGWFKINQS